MIISIALVTCLIRFSQGAKILMLFPMPSPSHVVLGHELALELVKKGHQILMITPYPKYPKIDNFKEIHVTKLSETMFKEKNNFFDLDNVYPIMQLMYCYKLGYMVLEETYSDPKIKTLLKSNETFDLFIMDQFFSEGLLGIAHHFQAPVILLSSVESSLSHHIVSNPAFYSYIPNIYLPSPSLITFFRRVHNTLMNLSAELYRRLIAFPYNEDIMLKFCPTAPTLDSLMYNVSLMLVNSHFSIVEPSPKVPNMIDVAGMHIKPKNKLRKDIQSFLDDSTNGVIYFSLGSNLIPSTLPHDKREALLRAFSKLNVNVLFKWDRDELPGQPKNVKIGKWFPQAGILAHPNVRAFISHGGFLSIIESVNFAVPMIGIPVYSDQIMNVARAVANGFAVSIPYRDLSEDKLIGAIEEVLQNPKYKENAKIRSNMMHDRPMKPMDTAVYWTEYVIRYKGAPHLRSAAMELKWWQIELIDVMIFLLAAIFGILSLHYYIYKMLFKRKNSVQDQKKKK